jgi:hypothetical protein
VIEAPLTEAGFSAAEIDRLVRITDESKDRPYGFTFSDLTQRLLPTLVLDAYPDRPVAFPRAVEIVSAMKATPPFRDGGAS